MKAKTIIPVGLAAALIGWGTYEFGQSRGRTEGIQSEKAELAILLEMERHDALDFARYAGNSKAQEELLDYAAALRNTALGLKRVGHFNGIDETQYPILK